MGDADDQTDERLALASIYDSAFTSQTDSELCTGTLKAAVELSQPLLVSLAGEGKQLWIPIPESTVTHLSRPINRTQHRACLPISPVPA